ncbi:MAG: helix-turn-helix transcriptional regulator [Phascolarctobacterium sp.]
MDKRNFENFAERFGYEIEHYRIFHDIKQCDLAKVLHITQSALSKIEMGRHDITLGMFGRLVHVCGSYAIFMFLLAYYPNDLKARVRATCSAPIYGLFIAWTEYLKLDEPVAFKRDYDKDHFRVEKNN